MVMLRPPGKAYKIAKKIMGQKGVTVRPPKDLEKTKPGTPFLQH